MRVVVTFEECFIRAPNGTIYTRGVVDYNFITRYLEVFDDVRTMIAWKDCPCETYKFP